MAWQTWLHRCGSVASESAGSSLPGTLLGHSLCRSSRGRGRLDPAFAEGPPWGAGTAPGADPHPVPGRPAALQAVGCCFAAPGPFPYPSIFSEDFLAAPAAWDVLVSEISRPFTPPTAGVVDPVTPWGLTTGWIRGGA